MEGEAGGTQPPAPGFSSSSSGALGVGIGGCSLLRQPWPRRVTSRASVSPGGGKRCAWWGCQNLHPRYTWNSPRAHPSISPAPGRLGRMGSASCSVPVPPWGHTFLARVFQPLPGWGTLPSASFQGRETEAEEDVSIPQQGWQQHCHSWSRPCREQSAFSNPQGFPQGCAAQSLRCHHQTPELTAAMPPFHTDTNCPGWDSHSLASDVPAAPTSPCHHTPDLALGAPETTGPKAGMGGMQLGVSHPNPTEIPAAQSQPLLPIPISGTPQGSTAHPPPAPELPAVCDQRPLPATLNTCHGNQRLPQGAFHSGKPHPPHSGSCFRDIPTLPIPACSGVN